MANDRPFDFFCSWSGGKDSCLALFRMLNAGCRCRSLFTMVDETGRHSRSHNLSMATLEIQASALGHDIHIGHASWNDYEKEFIKMIFRFKEKGVDHGVFGDIDLEPHKAWVERVCQEADVTAHEPLWKEERSALIREFIEAGFRARIVVINTKLMPAQFLGREIDMELVEELDSLSVDACGENGEYHSFVFAGPLFAEEIAMSNQNTTSNEGYIFLNFDASIS